jgi:hypothetical protein
MAVASAARAHASRDARPRPVPLIVSAVPAPHPRCAVALQPASASSSSAPVPAVHGGVTAAAPAAAHQQSAANVQQRNIAVDAEHPASSQDHLAFASAVSADALQGCAPTPPATSAARNAAVAALTRVRGCDGSLPILAAVGAEEDFVRDPPIELASWQQPVCAQPPFPAVVRVLGDGTVAWPHTWPRSLAHAPWTEVSPKLQKFLSAPTGWAALRKVHTNTHSLSLSLSLSLSFSFSLFSRFRGRALCCCS